MQFDQIPSASGHVFRREGKRGAVWYAVSARPPMRSPRRDDRVPGFPPPAEPPDRERHEPRRSSGTGTSPPVEDYRNAPLRQFNTRLLDPLHARYRRLVRALEDEGHRVSMNELVHAVLHDGPRTPAEARAAVRNWRRTLDPDP